MAHGNNLIHSIKLPNGTTYEIHDAQAIHNLSDIESLGLSGAFIYKGTVATVDALPATGNKVGYVYHVTEDGNEYVWTSEGTWEEFGSHIAVNHVHTVSVNAALQNGAATVTGTNSPSSVTGTAQVNGVNADSDVTASGSVSVPKISKEANYIDVTSSIGSVAVAGDGTANAITGFGTHTTAKAITALNTTKVNSASAADVSIPNVTANTSVSASKIDAAKVVDSVSVTAGSAASWNASVTDGVMSFSFTANTPTAVTSTSKDVTSVSATNTTLGTPLSASKVSTSEVTVATGSKTTADAITALGTPTTAAALTGVKVTTQPTLSVELVEGTSTQGIYAGDTVGISSESKTVNVTGTAAGQKWTQGMCMISGTAAAQTWTQATGTVTGEINTTQGTTGLPQDPPQE